MPDPNTSAADAIASHVPWDFEPIDAKLDEVEALQELLAGELLAAPQPAEISETTDSQVSETELLSWALLDGVIDTPGKERLEMLMQTDEEAVKTYVDCALLHADLHAFFTPTTH